MQSNRRDRFAALRQALLELSQPQLEQAHAFVNFLAHRRQHHHGPESAVVPPPATPGVSEESVPEEPAPEGSIPAEPTEPPEPNDGDVASLAWMLRLLFGDAALPEEAVSLDGPMPYKRLHDTPLIAQQQTEWCWAATAQMILSTLGDSRFHGDSAAAQLRLVRSADPLWRNHLPAEKLNTGGWPPFQQWGFDCTIVANPDTLSVDQVQAEIDSGRPFAISWHYPQRGGHMLVVAGYLWVGDTLWLVAHDPWPAGPHGGDRSLISYQHYVTGLAGTWRTYFKIQPAAIAAKDAKRGPPTQALQTATLPDSAPSGSPLEANTAAAMPAPDSPKGTQDPSVQDPSTQGWEAFLEVLGDSEQRSQALGKAISLIRALASPGRGFGQDLGIFSSEPGGPEHIHFTHAMPVLELPRRLDLDSEDAMMSVFSSFNRAVVMIGGEHGHLTSVTLRQSRPGGAWKVIRIGRSHLVKAFNGLNALMTEGLTFSIGGRNIVASRHLTHLPLVMIRMPDTRQYLLMMEVVGTPRQDVPFLFFPVYNDSGLGFEPGRALTLEDLQVTLDRAS